LPPQLLVEKKKGFVPWKRWWARKDLNLGPRDYESPALTAELRARILPHVKHSILTATERSTAAASTVVAVLVAVTSL
jgi:hypothetical protein